MMKNTRCLVLLCTILSLLLLASCGPSNTVHLQPLKHGENVLPPAPAATTVSVVRFADKREDTTALGLRRDSSYFTTMDSVPEWVSTGIADELTARGYMVTYAATAAQAIKGQPEYILTGSVETVDVRENSATSFEVNIRVKYVLSSREKKVVLETLTANQTRSTLPSGNAVEDLLNDTLRDIVNPMCQKVQAAIGR